MQETDQTIYIKLGSTASENFTATSTKPASGIGFAVASNKIIDTNPHVINGAITIKVRGIICDFTEQSKFRNEANNLK